MAEEFSKLIEPQYSKDGSTCYHIYSHRKYAENHKPITEKIYQQQLDSREQELWLMNIGVGVFISTLLIAFVYGVGAVASWIIKGFKRTEAK